MNSLRSILVFTEDGILRRYIILRASKGGALSCPTVRNALPNREEGGQIFIVDKTVGNRLTDIAGNSYTYNNGNELLTQNGTSFSYDANGNMITKTDATETTRYTYNSENQLIRVELPDGKIAEYKYDPFGRRIEKTITDTVNGTRTTRYVYDREDILFELDGSGNVITEYLHGPGIDEPIGMIRNNQTYYYHADALGSIIAITDSYGRVVQRYEYDSFGNITYQQDPSFVQPYTYTGREYDTESGLYYYRARYYDAKVGRFISQDPLLSPLNPMALGISSSMNKLVWLLPYLKFNPKNLYPFVYVANSPLKWVDPWGLIQCKLIDVDEKKLPEELKEPFEKIKPYIDHEIPGTEKLPGEIKPWVDFEKKGGGLKLEFKF